jgi:tetratricopeptide (TPR) repeat protein
LAAEGKKVVSSSLGNSSSWRNDDRSEQLDKAVRNSSAPFVLPKIDVVNFTGRLDELAILESQLLGSVSDKTCSIVGLSGGGGMGKSALAFHFATLHRDKFPDGVIGLPVDGKATHEVARDFARRCGKAVDEDDDRSASTIMQEVFAHRRMLLIFDNADQAALKELRPGGDRCALIVTTRNRKIPDFFGIPSDGIIDLPPMPQEDARNLLRRILGADRVNAELEATDQIISMTGGLPLALQIVGSALRGRQRTLSSCVESLRDEKTRVQRLYIQDDKDLNVTLSLNWSFNLLQENEKDLFACLSVCAKDGFSLRTAMISGDMADEHEAQKLLDRLYQLSLLNEVSADQYVFHALVRVYAQEKAQERAVWEAASHRHAKYFIDFIQANDVECPEIAKEIIADFEDILQAAQWLRKNAISSDLKESAYQFALDLRPFLLKYSHSKKAIELMTGFQVWAEQLDDWYASVRFKIQHAKYLALEGQLSEAEVILNNAEDLIERISDPIQRQESRLKQLNSLGGILRKQKKFDESIATFQQEIVIAEACNDQKQIAIGLHGLGLVFQDNGNLEAAITSIERSIVISETLNDQISLILGLNHLGKVLQNQRKFEKSAIAFERSIAVAEALNDKTSLVIGLTCLGGVLQKQGDLDAAITIFERQIAIKEELDDQRGLAIGLNRLGCLLLWKHKFEAAINIFEREISIDRQMNDKRQLLIGLNCLGRTLHQFKQYNEAISVFKEQIEIARTLDDPKNIAVGWGCLEGV